MPALRRGDAAGEVHEPLVVLLPEMPAEAAGAASLIPRERARLLVDTPQNSSILRTLAGMKVAHYR